MITSKQNPKIKLVQSLQTSSRTRKSESQFVVEGVRLIEEAFLADWKTDFVLHTDEINPRGVRLIEEYENKGIPTIQISSNIMHLISETENPQGLLAVLKWESLPIPKILDFILIADQIRDPGNLGTIIRTADAVGVQAVITTPGSVDFLSPKVVRAGMGSHFHIPILSKEYEQIASLSNKLNYYLASVQKGHLYTEMDYLLPSAIIIGGEAEGASQSIIHLADKQIHIPMSGKSESLNAAIAAGILLFEVVRQRKINYKKSNI